MENNPKELSCPSLSLDQSRVRITTAVISSTILHCIISCGILSFPLLLYSYCYEPTDPVLEIAGTVAEWSCQMSGDPSPGLILTPTHMRADVPTWPWPILIPVEVPDGSCQKGSKRLNGALVPTSWRRGFSFE